MLLAIDQNTLVQSDLRKSMLTLNSRSWPNIPSIFREANQLHALVTSSQSVAEHPKIFSLKFQLHWLFYTLLRSSYQYSLSKFAWFWWYLVLLISSACVNRNCGLFCAFYHSITLWLKKKKVWLVNITIPSM